MGSMTGGGPVLCSRTLLAVVARAGAADLRVAAGERRTLPPAHARRALVAEHLCAALLVLEEHEADHRREPVEHVREHGADRRVVRPPEDRVEHRPAVVVEVVVGVAAVEVPHVAAHVVGSGAVACGTLVVDICAEASMR